MHLNREISYTSCSKERDRSAKVLNRTADTHVQEKSDCAVVPGNRSNKEAQACAAKGVMRSTHFRILNLGRWIIEGQACSQFLQRSSPLYPQLC